MRKCQGRKVLILFSKRGKLGDHIDQLFLNEPEAFAHNDDVGIISHIARSSAKVDDRLCLRALKAVSVNMRHDIMPYDLLPLLCILIIDIILMRLQFTDLLIRYIKSEFFLCLRESDPEFSPCSEFHVRREDILHLFTCVSLGQRALISVCSHGHLLHRYLSAGFIQRYRL